MKTWERTKTPGLLRHKGGRYYGRFSIGGKTKFVPLNCTLMEIARVRFAEEKAKIERVRRAARANEQGVATLGQLLEIYRGRITNKTGIAESTRKRNLENVGFIQRTWPGIEKLHPGLITRTEIENWRDRALSKGTGFRPPGAKSESTLVSGRSASSFNKALDALRTMLDYAVDAGTIHVNPVRGNDGLKAKLDPKKPQLENGHFGGMPFIQDGILSSMPRDSDPFAEGIELTLLKVGWLASEEFPTGVWSVLMRNEKQNGILVHLFMTEAEIRARTIEPFPANEPTASVRFELPAPLPR